MEMLDLKSTIENYHEMISSDEILGWQEWMKISENMLWHKFVQEEERSAREMKANRKLDELRPDFKSRSDAEIKWKTTPEYQEWQEKEKLIDNLSSFAAITRNKANMLNKF